MKSAVKQLKAEAKPTLDEPIPEINVPIIKPTQYVKLQKVESSVNKDINKFVDWILSVVPEPIVRNVNSRIEQLKEKVRNTVYRSYNPPPPKIWRKTEAFQKAFQKHRELMNGMELTLKYIS